MTIVAGVDGCPKGWIAVVLSDGHFVRAELARTFADLLPRPAAPKPKTIHFPIEGYAFDVDRDFEPAGVEVVNPTQTGARITTPGSFATEARRRL